VPVRLSPADPRLVECALARLRAGRAEDADLRLLTKHYLALLCARAPGRSVEVRVPPYAVVQCVSGARHTRGTPPAVVETDPATWARLSCGDLSWAEACRTGRVVASGERSDLSALFPRPADQGQTASRAAAAQPGDAERVE
jgi:uncharacterized SCP-like protein